MQHTIYCIFDNAIIAIVKEQIFAMLSVHAMQCYNSVYDYNVNTTCTAMLIANKRLHS